MRIEKTIYDFYDLPEFPFFEGGGHRGGSLSEHCIGNYHGLCRRLFRSHHPGKEAADSWNFGDCQVDPLSNVRGLPRFRNPLPGHLRQLIVAVERCHEVDQIPHDGRFVSFPAQLVVYAVEAFRGGVQPLFADFLHDDCASIDEPAEQGRYGSDVHAGAGCDLAGTRRLPEVDHREVDTAFGLCEADQVRTKILRMVVDQADQIFHQLVQGAMLREPCDDDQESRVAAGQDLERPDLPSAHRVAADRQPQTSALFGIQRFQLDDSEQLEEWLPRVVQPLEATGGGSEQDDLGLRLQRLAELPSEIFIHVSAQGLQVLDHQDNLPSQPIGRIQGSRASVIFQLLPAPPGRQIGVRIPELLRSFRIGLANLPCEVEQRFEPEVAQIEDLLALLHEPDRQQLFRELPVGAQLRSNARQQHGFSASARRHEQDVLARWRSDVSTEDFEHDAEFVLSDHELPDQFFIGLKRPGIELADPSQSSR